jgi:hypothetical protein
MLRTASPLLALASLTITALVVTAQTGVAFCNRRIDVPMPDMAGMSIASNAAVGPMIMTHGIMICPIVLALICLTSVLAAATVVIISRDPHRALSARLTLLSLSRLPRRRTAVTLATLAIFALTVISLADGHGPPSIEACAALLGIVLTGASLATAFSFYAARVIITLSTRLYFAIAAYFELRDCTHSLVVPNRTRLPVAKVRLVSRCRGLRAPPIFAR